nr:hypothetical protein [Halorubellus sp. JP-L1]
MLEALDYPVTPAEAAAACSDVTLELADGEEPFADVVTGSSADAFESPDELASEVMSLLPREAVGEPYQSEGEG